MDYKDLIKELLEENKEEMEQFLIDNLTIKQIEKLNEIKTKKIHLDR